MDQLIRHHVSDVFINEWKRSYYHEPMLDRLYRHGSCAICRTAQSPIIEVLFRYDNGQKRVIMCDGCIKTLKQKLTPYISKMMTLKYNHFRNMLYYRTYEPVIIGSVSCINCNKLNYQCVLIQLNSEHLETICAMCFASIRSQSYKQLYLYSAIVLSALVADVQRLCVDNLVSLVIIR